MSIWDITTKFIYLILIMIIGMMLITSFRKMRIAISLRRLCSKINGRVFQRGIRSFPRFDGKYDGREASIFFHTARTKKAHLVYLLFAITVNLPFRLFLLRNNEFKYLEGFNMGDEVGTPLDGIDNGFKAWSNDADSARLFLDDTGLKGDIDLLTEFSSILFGPDLIIIGKQYEGRKDLSADKLLERLAIMGKMAEMAEVICKEQKR